jgi:hypothetical protein
VVNTITLTILIVVENIFVMIKFKFTSSVINNKLLISKIIEIILYITEINNKNLSAMKNKPLISKIIEIILYITEINN